MGEGKQSSAWSHCTCVGETRQISSIAPDHCHQLYTTTAVIVSNIIVEILVTLL